MVNYASLQNLCKIISYAVMLIFKCMFLWKLSCLYVKWYSFSQGNHFISWIVLLKHEIFAFSIISLRWHRLSKSWVIEGKNVLFLHFQYHGCWWTGDWRKTGGCLNTKMPSYQYGDSHYKGKTASWLSYLYNGNSHTRLDHLYIETGCTKSHNLFLVSACSCLCAIYWSQVWNGEWRFSWNNANRRCFNYIWVINNLIAY